MKRDRGFDQPTQANEGIAKIRDVIASDQWSIASNFAGTRRVKRNRNRASSSCACRTADSLGGYCQRRRNGLRVSGMGKGRVDRNLENHDFMNLQSH